ncbi:hypothetical protein FE249_20325 (plasmid) [Acidiphilium multivorum]|uniref:hypothetical protein n=1 Tax=Acidiphilium multivorum TaxID=62140 RepID=UPI001F4BD8C1|nr:hypothetical protein [Acidiphilium multivorum]UNC16532.1 hypothetical protein FE249_20325 [Acidiphilium multivorum]
MEQHLPWKGFVKSINAARKLTTTETTEARAELLGRHATIRRFALVLLDMLSFQGAQNAAGLLKNPDASSTRYSSSPPAAAPSAIRGC